MSKRRKLKSDLPPEGLWIRPGGERIQVVEHLLALQHYPDLFGLPFHSTLAASISTLRDLAEGLIRDGWIRFRYLSGTYAFEVDDAKRRMDTIISVLEDVGAFAGENVAISQVTPLREFQGTVADAQQRSIIRFQENPTKNRWRFTQRRKGQHYEA